MNAGTKRNSFTQFLKSFFPNRDDNLFRGIPLSTNGKLFVSPMPFGAYDPGNRLMKIYKRRNIDHVFILVTDDELIRKARRKLLDQYRAAGLEYSRFVIKDWMVPSLEVARAMTDKAKSLLGTKRVVVHCHAGVGRTAVAVCCIGMFIEGWTAQEAIRNICRAMPVNISDEQRRFIDKYADSL
ncbi:MAG: dual specificity protein phosphatase family protein [Chitinispirillaceae bacterium]|nr:dual specificity protein phosphatase family protein [Chitinispirillaceae bacterium]